MQKTGITAKFRTNTSIDSVAITIGFSFAFLFGATFLALYFFVWPIKPQHEVIAIVLPASVLFFMLVTIAIQVREQRFRTDMIKKVGQQLVGADFSKKNLRKATFIAANLLRADFRYADLSYADLEGAQLSYARLESATLLGANLRKANLTGASLAEANLYGADLRDAILLDANLSLAHLVDVKFNDETILPNGSKWTAETLLRETQAGK